MKLLKPLGLLMAGLMAWFSPIQQIPHGEAGCCAECAMKKEDEIEFVEEVKEEEDTEI